MRNLRFSRVWRITVSQSVADVGGQTWSPFSQSLIYFQSGDFAVFLRRLWQCWKKPCNQVAPHARFTCTNFLATNGIKALSYSVLCPLAQLVERPHEGISVTRFPSGHWTFHTRFLNGLRDFLELCFFQYSHFCSDCISHGWSRHCFLPTWVILCGLFFLWLFHLFHWDMGMA